jgi:hypothetical protein
MCEGWDASALVLVPNNTEDLRSLQEFNCALRNQQQHKHKVRSKI